MDQKDCMFCWCDTCADIGLCTQQRDNIAETEPGRGMLKLYPCVGCVDGEKFKPRLRIADETPPECFMPF